GNPAARALPLLEALAARRPASVVLDYLPDTRLHVDIVMPTASGAFPR
ncbi:beta-ketoacyl synthase chain length factor, partial [Ralstonia pseudosolanacearum]